jgi:polar amino acid transport system substrate-binding protein
MARSREQVAQLRTSAPGRNVLLSVALGLALLAPAGPAPAAAPPGRSAPSLWDPHHRPDKPDMKSLRQIRFLTEDEFPPFNFAGAGGALEGFNVDLARAICAELGVTCTIQARRWDTIVAAIETGQADVIAAGLAATPEARSRLLFTDPYFRLPARFATQRSNGLSDFSAASLAGKRIAVTAGTSHEAWLAAFLPAARRVPKPTDALARETLMKGEADALFGDGVALSFWVNGTASKDCCTLAGGPYLESRFFGPGLAMAVRPENTTLKRAIDFALFQLWERGTWADLVRRWFPVDPFVGDH